MERLFSEHPPMILHRMSCLMAMTFTAGLFAPALHSQVVQEAYLKASNTDAFDIFGNAVSVSGDTVAVGAPFEASNATGVNGNQGNNSADSAGAVYIFVRSETGWAQQAYLKASN